MAMNGEIPSVPVTTLAGISSLTDCKYYLFDELSEIFISSKVIDCIIWFLVLPEMPLPSPLPHTLSNKSLLFHPRVAEEANNLLNLRDENLVPLLANSLSQTTSEHM